MSLLQATSVNPKPLTLTITGDGAGTTVIDGNAAGSVFTIGSKAKVTLVGMVIQNGSGNLSHPSPP